MLGIIISFLVGIVGGAIILFFIARNNTEKALKYLSKDLKVEIEKIQQTVEKELATIKAEKKEKILSMLDSLKKKLNL